MVGSWSAREFVLAVAADEVPSLDTMDQANGIACLSVALGDLPCLLGAETRMLPPSHLPLAEHSSLLASQLDSSNKSLV